MVAASWYDASPGSTYEVDVYVNPTSGPINSSGQSSVTTGTITDAGYHTVRLSTPVSVTSGQKFSVVVKLTTPGYNYPIPMENAMVRIFQRRHGKRGTGLYELGRQVVDRCRQLLSSRPAYA